MNFDTVAGYQTKFYKKETDIPVASKCLVSCALACTVLYFVLLLCIH